MRQQVITVTEQGEGHITNALLLGIMADTLYQALQSNDFGGPTCASICASLNLLGKLGWIEVRERDRPAASGPDIKTDDPPSFLMDAFRFNDREGGDGEAGG